jgi:hypothetical protein
LLKILEANRVQRSGALRVAGALTSGKWTDDYPISLEEVQRFGLRAHDYTADAVYALMGLYSQAGGRHPSVRYIPTPYQPLERREGKRVESA